MRKTDSDIHDNAETEKHKIDKMCIVHEIHRFYVETLNGKKTTRTTIHYIREYTEKDKYITTLSYKVY